MSRTIPPLLEPYLALPPETALLVLTGVLGASTNWLVLRHLHALLKPRPQTTTTSSQEQPEEEEEETSLLLVSFLRDYPFWRDGSARLGLDLEALAKKGRFGFVDGLGGLFVETPQQGGRWPSLRSAEVGEVEGAVGGAVDALLRGGGRVVVVVDGMDFLVAAAAGGGGEAWRGVVMGLREVCALWWFLGCEGADMWLTCSTEGARNDCYAGGGQAVDYGAEHGAGEGARGVCLVAGA